MPRRIVAAALAAALALAGSRVSAASPESPYPADPDRIPEDERGPLAPTSSDPAELVMPPITAALNARRLIDAGRDAEAAPLLEALSAQLGDLRFLYHAGLARARAGHHVLAARLLAAWLERSPGASEAARALVAARLAAEQAALVQVAVDLVEGTVGASQPLPSDRRAAARVTVERLSDGGSPVPQYMWEEPGPFGGVLQLDPGQWRLRVEVPGYMPIAYVGAATPGARWEVFLQRRQVAVDLRFSPPKALRSARLVLRSTDNPTPTTMDRALSGPTQTVVLPVGGYHVDVIARRHEAHQDFNAGPEPGAVDIVLRPRGAGGGSGDGKLKIEKKPLLALLGLFTVGFYGGIGLILGGANVESRADKLDAGAREAAGVDPESRAPLDPAAAAIVEKQFPTADYHRRLALAGDTNTAGIVVAMADVGVLLALLPVMLRKPRRDLFIPLGVGVAALGGGASWLALAVRNQKELLEPATIEHRTNESAFDKLTGPRLGAGMLTGIGVGMILFPVAYLIGEAAARRRSGRVSAAPLAGPGQAGLVLRGRF